MLVIAEYIVCSSLVDLLLQLSDILVVSLEDARTKGRSWLHSRHVPHPHAVEQQVQS